MDQRLNIVKMSLVLKLTYIFHVIPVRISAHFAHACMCVCVKMNMLILKFI